MLWRILKNLEGSRLAVAGLCVAAVLFLAVNVLANTAFTSLQFDLTQNRLFTVSEGTHQTLRDMDEPVTLRLYFSRSLGEAAPRYATYYERVRELLKRYEDISGGGVRLTLVDPEPFSDAEDRAVADGLQGVPVTTAGDLGYFGLAGENSTDGTALIPFFTLEREPFLEYDLTKLIHGLANPDQPTLGLITTLPMVGNGPSIPGGRRDWLVVDQLREFFHIQVLETDIQAIPDDIGLLMVVEPSGLGSMALFAIDQFVLRGGRALVFVDPSPESGMTPGMPPPPANPDANRLLESWGLSLVPDSVAADLDNARRVSTGGSGRGVVVDYPAWLSLATGYVDTDDPVMSNVERLHLATAGILEKQDGASTEVRPLIVTSPQSMRLDIDRVRPMPDVMGILRDFEPDGHSRMLSARVTGTAATAFPEGSPVAATEDDSVQAPSFLDTARKPINVIVVADTDLLADRFWVSTGDFFGQQVNVPTASNGDFVLNALENLSGSDALIGLRGRGHSDRPFTLVEDIRRHAERRYRAEEQRLQDELKDLQMELNRIRHRETDAGEVLLTGEDKAALDRFRREILSVRKKLRDVQLALRTDIDRLQTWVKFINIAAVPLLLGLVIAALGMIRYYRRAGPHRAKLSNAERTQG